MKNMQTVRGTFDLLGDRLDRHRAIQKIAFDKASLYGYQEIVTPIFEYTHVFTKPLGETSDIVGKEMYTFEDRGGESITLRPEGTAPVLRAILSEGLTQTMPQRRITVGPFFRYERPQKGRYRQFHQISVECIGIESFHADVEMISLAVDILNACGIPDVTLHLNTLGDPESRLAYRKALVEYFSAHQDQLSQDSQLRLHKNPLRILDSKDSADQSICAHAPKIQDYLTQNSRTFFENLCQALTQLNIPFKVDPSLVRGMDYYCHTVFEFKSTALGAQDTVLGGGRYDGLMEQMGGPSLPAIGFGAGVERLALLATSLDIPKYRPAICLIPLGEMESLHAQVIAKKLRENNVYVDILLSGKVQKRLAHAAKKEAIYSCVIGEDEIKSDCYTIRRLDQAQNESAKDVSFTLDEMIAHLKCV